MVDDDAEPARSLARHTGLLELGEGEAAALAQLGVVADGLATDGRAEGLEGADTEGSGLGDTGITPAQLAAGLVEPCADAALPVLAEVVTVKDYISQEISEIRCDQRSRGRAHRCSCRNPLRPSRDEDQTNVASSDSIHSHLSPSMLVARDGKSLDWGA